MAVCLLREGKAVTLGEYLAGKYRGANCYGFSHAEACVMGLPFPLRAGWVEEYSGLEISAVQARTIVGFLVRWRDRAKSDRRREIVQRGIDTLYAEFGPMFDIEATPEAEQPAEPRADRVSQRRAKRKARKAEKAKAKRALQHDKPMTVDHQFAVSDAFLQSFEWRRIRMVVLKRDGAKCRCCGATPATGAVMNVDHIKPRRIFPELALDPNNLQVLCGDCNHGKGNWDMTDWRAKEAV